ncbi:hypothetical protein BO86DRAFT_250095 [Aspergillus japonicus CBS 114.51]|uniref:Uncharacterized protein n=1 Tax=Aspergillus japonicus CBS 114.51 TaxID=1448312 RepID=A0A8T8WLJ7_ASPJA|nr:hypothetical protein BO86DRAFT_250095 [Aspergillus japonicus CBS 114.51]RAH76522.1 hypothetical protein BO86DRAFT_250095 [Aspergillus japonicus CBS 114.51]
MMDIADSGVCVSLAGDWCSQQAHPAISKQGASESAGDWPGEGHSSYRAMIGCTTRSGTYWEWLSSPSVSLNFILTFKLAFMLRNQVRAGNLALGVAQAIRFATHRRNPMGELYSRWNVQHAHQTGLQKSRGTMRLKHDQSDDILPTARALTGPCQPANLVKCHQEMITKGLILSSSDRQR